MSTIEFLSVQLKKKEEEIAITKSNDHSHKSMEKKNLIMI